ncbi:hypothetical protein AAHE18_02G060900 [Arachis hypogaea]
MQVHICLGSKLHSSIGDEDYSNVSKEPQNEKEFNEVEDAYASYVAYAKSIGFAVKNGDSIKDHQENIVRKFFYYNWQQLCEKKHYERVDRKRPQKSKMRTNCNVKFFVSGQNLWEVVDEDIG